MPIERIETPAGPHAATVATGAGIEVFRWHALIARLKIEQRGMRFKVNTSASLKREFGMPRNARIAKVIERAEQELKKAEEALEQEGKE